MEEAELLFGGVFPQGELVVSTSGDGESEGGRKGSSEAVSESNDAIAFVGRLLAKRALDLKGGLTPEAAIQADLRDDEDRGRILEQLVQELVPEGASPAIWLRWLTGGDGPFTSNGIKRPAKQNQGTGKTIKRGPASLAMHYDRVERARAELAHAEDTLAYHRALDRSYLEYAVADHLIRLLAPVFSMGPAWTLMRALSAHQSDEMVARAVKIVPEKNRPDAIAQLRREREEETEKLLDALDFFSGHEPFENMVRSALLEVVENAKDMRTELASAGRKTRSKEKRDTTVNPAAKSAASAVLEGLSRKPKPI